MLLAAFMVDCSTMIKHGFVTKALYLVTSFVHGAFVGLMPNLCLRIFGPSTHFIPHLKSEQQVYLQRVQLAIKLYERYIFEIGTFLAIAIASCLIYFLEHDAALIWTISGLLVAFSYIFASCNEFRRFKADLVTVGNVSSLKDILANSRGSPSSHNHYD